MQKLNFIVGTGLQVMTAGGSKAYSAELIGMKAGKSLLISLGEALPGLVEGDEVSVNYGSGEERCCFSSRVMLINETPFYYLHLQYPEKIQSASMRRTVRVPVEGAAMNLSILDGERRISVVMADVSQLGSKLVAAERLGEIGDSFNIEMMDPSGDNEDVVVLPCSICYIRKEPSTDQTQLYSHGVEFGPLDGSAQLFISRFIQKSVIKQRNMPQAEAV